MYRGRVELADWSMDPTHRASSLAIFFGQERVLINTKSFENVNTKNYIIKVINIAIEIKQLTVLFHAETNSFINRMFGPKIGTVVTAVKQPFWRLENL